MQLLCCRNFIKLEKKNFYIGFQKATWLSFIGFSSRWRYQLGVSVGLLAHHLVVGVGGVNLGLRSSWRDTKNPLLTKRRMYFEYKMIIVRYHPKSF